MDDLVHMLRWTSAAVGVVFFLLGIFMAAGSRGVTRNFGWFALQFGAALLLFNVGGLISGHRAWSLAAIVAGAVLLASSIRKLFTLRS
jgi:hypothetical protein